MMAFAHRPPRASRSSVVRAAAIRVMVLVLTLCAPAMALAQAWLPGGWSYRRSVTVASPGGATLSSFQVQVALPADFDFAHAKPDGSDLRVTADDGTTLVPFHLDQWNAGSHMARFWVRVPAIPAEGTLLYVYYGNPTTASASNGEATYEFFDDFDGSVGLGYYPLSASQTLLVKDQSWETQGPHTLSVVNAPAGAAWPYYGYYGLEDCTGIGMAGSTDMVHWAKFATNPLFTGGGERWPSVIQDGATYDMVHTVNFCTVSSIVRRSSADGLHWSAPTPLVAPEPGWYNQNPNLWHDPNDGKFYLYWFRGTPNTVWRIMARSASTVAGLATAPETQVIGSSVSVAAPNMMYRDGTYFLVAETFDTVWKVVVYGGPTPLGPFTLLPGNPILGGDCACMFQHPVGSTVYEYYCKRNGSTWTLDLVQADLAAGRRSEAFLDAARWTPSGGSWSAPSAVQHDGVTGTVAQGSTPYYDILKSSYTGNDYVFEAQGRLVAGRIFGIGVRMADPDNGYSVNLYDDLDDTDNVYIYRWVNGVGTEIWTGAAGPIDKNTWYKIRLKVGPQGFRLWLGDSLLTPGWVGANPDLASGPPALYLEDGTGAQFDDARVYKFAPADPAVTVGGEGTQANTPPVAVIAGPTNGAAVWPAQATALTSGSTDAQDGAGSLAYRWDVRMRTQRGDSVVVLAATTRNASFSPPAGDDSTIVSYRIVHRVIDTGGASDSAAVVVWPEVDLEPAALAVSPPAPVGADSLTFSFRLRNHGRAPAARTRWRLVTDGGILVAEGERAVPGLDSALVTARVASLGPCARIIVRVVADTLAGLRETNEANNAAMLAFTSGPGSPPAAIADLSAGAVGNTGSGRANLSITWSGPGVGRAMSVYRKAYGDYPLYRSGPGGVPAVPATPALALSQGWALTGATTSGALDAPAARGLWYYVAFATDACGTVSGPSNLTAGVLNYLLGDVGNGTELCSSGGESGDGVVDLVDVSALGARYGSTFPATDDRSCFDVGPTVDYGIRSRPQPDGRLDFEDLVVYALNYGAHVLATQSAPRAAPAFARGTDELQLTAPDAVRAGESFDAVLRLSGSQDLHAVSARLVWDAGVAEATGYGDGALLASSGAVAFSPAPGAVDAAVLGAPSPGFTGEGELAVFHFRALVDGAPGVRLAGAMARDAANRAVTFGTTSAPPPARPSTAFGSVFPNPFRGTLYVSYSLALDTRVSLTVFDLAGRVVRRLDEGERPAGAHVVAWDGRTDAGRSAGAGLYVLRLQAGEVHRSRRVQLIR